MQDANPPTSPLVVPGAAARVAGVAAWINSKSAAGVVELTGAVNTDRDFDGRYELFATKLGGGGSSTTRQGGRISVRTGQTASLSHLAVGVLGAGDSWQAILRIYEGERLLTQVESGGRY